MSLSDTSFDRFFFLQRPDCPEGINDFWLNISWLLLILFVIGTFISRSLVDFSKYASFIVSFKYVWVLWKSDFYRFRFSESKNDKLFLLATVLLLFSITLSFYLLIRIGYSFSFELILFFFVGTLWPLVVWILGWVKGFFTSREIGYWWFLNGLHWWFVISFGLSNIDTNSYTHLKEILFSAFCFTTPTTLFFLFIKMSGGTFFLKRINILFKVFMISVGVLGFMGLPSFLDLASYWDGWQGLSKALSLSYNPNRLSSFHFVLDTGNILAQSFFISLGWFLLNSSLEKKAMWRWGKILYCCLLLVFFLFTWTKLLIPLVGILLTIFLFFAFKNHYRLFLRLMMALLIAVTILLITENRLSEFSQDVMKVSQVVKENFLQKNEKPLIEDVIEADIVNSVSFIYRLQHYIWGMRILLANPLTGIGPFAYTDYVIANFKKDLLWLPSVIIDMEEEEVSSEKKKEMIYSETGINRAILGTHSDWVMIVSSGGVPGMFFYYGFFGILIFYFLSCYRKDDNIFSLGIVFGLLAMMASGITEPNFKNVHFHIFTMYVLLFFCKKFIFIQSIQGSNMGMDTMNSSENLKK